MARQSNGVSAISRVVMILDTFSFEAPFLSLSEIAERAAIPMSSAHRIVTELVEHGLLERMPDRSYRVGNRLWEMGSRTPGALGLREIALPFLHAIQSRVRQHTQLLVRSGLDVLVIERLSSRDAVVNASIVGGRIPMQHSSSGIVLLANADDEVLARVLERGLSPITGSSLATPEQLRDAVAAARRTGFAVSEGWIFEESRGIAVPVRGSQEVVVGTVSVVVPNDHSPVDDLVRLLRLAAEGISEALLRSYLPPGHPHARAGGVYRQLVSSSDRSMEYFEQLLEEHGSAVHDGQVNSAVQER
ncbi:IclR family transcriptional regulator [Pseudolysinimonas sp.]|uniref:IclR family transcriptional regulator n=1 Tax=Pseudolysinimonas sp. TaxID=2680009 RepID=UPI00286CA4E0|nr:IclR family transcriptional regulator [Pseudolysinimonas sp.]